MKNVIYVLAYDRPGFLFHTLRLIAKNKDFRNHHFVFVLDYGYDDRCAEVIRVFIKKYKLDAETLLVQKTPFTIGKQSFALITGYRHCITLDCNLIHFIEDDVFISNDYFKYQTEVHKNEKFLFCSIGTRNNNSNDPTVNNITAYYTKKNNEYQSLGVTWSKLMLQRVLELIPNSYFADPYLFCYRNFPDSEIGDMYVEQDGLIRRIKEKHFLDLPVAYPHVPRGYHAGFQGKNRRGKYLLDDDLSLRIKQIQRICFNDENMRWIVKNPEEYYDSTPVPLVVENWEHLHKVEL